MKKRILDLLFGTRTMSMLLLVFAASMAAGTFIENSYDTPTSKIWVYNEWWFSLLMLWLMFSFIANIKRYQLFQWKKWATLTMHLSWILIIIGAGITRYISFEGMMLIREGKTEASFLSEETYYDVIIQGEDDQGNAMQRELKKRLLISRFDHKRSDSFIFYNQDVTITIDSLIYDAVEGLKPVQEGTGERYLKIVEAGGGNRHDHLIKDGEEASIHGVLFGVNIDPEEAAEKGLINITENWDGYRLQTPYEGDYLRMADQLKGSVTPGAIQPLQLRSLYTMAGMQFVIPDPIMEGEVGIIQSPEPTGSKAFGLLATITSGDESQKIEMRGGKGIISDYMDVEINDLKVYIKYGSIARELPFSIQLDDFIATKYPGTEKGYSAFESAVTVIEGDDEQKERIYMNNVLDKAGYRFFQAGFDPDELGTHLSVNYDFWGKTITYAGYYLLYLGLLALIIDPNTRFGELRRLINRVNKRKAKLLSMVVMLFATSLATAQNQNQTAPPGAVQTEDHSGHNHAPGQHGVISNAQEEDHSGHDHAAGTHSTAIEGREGVSTNQDSDNLKRKLDSITLAPEKLAPIPLKLADSIIVANMFPIAQAERFGRVVVQDNGRMKPMSTLASEILRRLSERDYYEAKVGDSIVRLTPEQTILSMMQFGQLWFDVPFIKLNYKNDSLKDIIGVDRSHSFARGMDFFRRKDSTMGGYKISPYLDEANAADVKSSIQNGFIDINYSMGLLDQTISGSIFKIFPKPGAENNRWYAPVEFEEAGFEREAEKNFVRDFIPAYVSLLKQGNLSGDYLRANTALNGLFEFQETYGVDVIPSKEKIDAEILYNKYDVFKGMYKWYLWFGVIMLILLIVEIIRPMKQIRWSANFHKWVIAGIFIVHTASLIMRWYLSGHAPWSDAYESLLYVAWATMAFGLMFGRKSEMTIASTAFVVSIILWVAQLNWLDPSITTLQPVLDSYWLMIHVAVIVGSYGPFALGMIIGLVSLILMIFSTKKNKSKMDLNIKELTYINEVALTVGLIMLTIGNFLGGMWANESWGRYWGWDPKETWALITIFIYAFVLHLRLVPGLKGRWTFNLWSVLAFASVLMTYFGVNFYLTGLHSYASGDQIISYQFALTTVVVVLVIAFIARYQEKKIYSKKNREE